ncbi:GNAT family N-acetyltransferase [Ammoniphilus resinae]|nr:GNAT family protein [Ammoniphilus resinae]
MEILESYKRATSDHIDRFCIPIQFNGEVIGRLRPVTFESLQNEEEMRKLAEWRRASAEWFTTQFSVSEVGTREWIREQVLHAQDRILFFVDDPSLTPIGQVGLCHYDEQKKECEFDNLLRGEKGQFANLIIPALIALGLWSIKVLDIQQGYLQVLANNFRAIHIYQKLGFQEVKRTPLVKRVEGKVVRWVPATDPATVATERHLVTMVIERKIFENLYKQGR